jgi:hypothetical protein
MLSPNAGHGVHRSDCQGRGKELMLYIYQELSASDRTNLKLHVSQCELCTDMLRHLRGLHRVLSSVKRTNPSPQLLAASRLLLSRALRSCRQSG